MASTCIFSLDLILAVTATLVRAASSLQLEPQFNDPDMATSSLQDFWGKRWNLMVSEIPRKWVSSSAGFSTFVVSGIMHELIFFYMGRLRPSWGMMSFFLLHGLCTMAEIALKKTVNRRWRLPTPVARTLTVLFVLSFLEFKRRKIDEKAFAEYEAVCVFLQKVALRVLLGYSRIRRLLL